MASSGAPQFADGQFVFEVTDRIISGDPKVADGTFVFEVAAAAAPAADSLAAAALASLGLPWGVLPLEGR